ncbi:MAG: archease [Acidobacteriota bacterium]
MSLELVSHRMCPVFEQAAPSLCACMTDLDSVMPRETRELEVSAADEERLFARWIEELVAVLTQEDTVFRRAEATILRSGPKLLTLSARLWGEPFDARRHRRKGVPHLAARPSLRRAEGCWRGDVELSLGPA